MFLTIQTLAQEESRSKLGKRRPHEDHLKMTNFLSPIEAHNLSQIVERPIVHTKILLLYKIPVSISLQGSNWLAQDPPDAQLQVKITVNTEMHSRPQRLCLA